MLFAIRYYNGNPNFVNSRDELILNYEQPHPVLPEKIQEYDEKLRIIMDYSKSENLDNFESDLEILKAAMENHKNFGVIINLDQIEAIEELKNAGIPYFFTEGIGTWDNLLGAIKLGVSDVRICNELAFSIDRVSKICKENNVLIRVYPNVAQTSSSFKNGEPVTKFFIRPEDLDLYEEIVDVIEFYGAVDRQQTLYSIYTNRKWLGNLNDLILDLNKDINNTTVYPGFGKYRMSCDKRCSYGKCNLCYRIYELSEGLNTALIEKEKLENN